MPVMQQQQGKRWIYEESFKPESERLTGFPNSTAQTVSTFTGKLHLQDESESSPNNRKVLDQFN